MGWFYKTYAPVVTHEKEERNQIVNEKWLGRKNITTNIERTFSPTVHCYSPTPPTGGIFLCLMKDKNHVPLVFQAKSERKIGAQKGQLV